MKRIVYHSLAFVALAIAGFASVASAGDGRTCPGVTPTPNATMVVARLWNDCPTSEFSSTNTLTDVTLTDNVMDCFGYANKHLWKFSADGGATMAQFENCSAYHFCADITATSTGNGETGLAVSPWWSAGDGAFMINYGTGEIACFGGRLPFYSFTAGYGLHYVKGTTVHCEITYTPNGLSQAAPATITYSITIGGTNYTSGPLAFDQANPTEDPPHDLWGELVPATVGGYFQPYCGAGVPWNHSVTFANICFDNMQVTPATTTSWGKVKTLYR